MSLTSSLYSGLLLYHPCFIHACGLMSPLTNPNLGAKTMGPSQQRRPAWSNLKKTACPNCVPRTLVNGVDRLYGGEAHPCMWIYAYQILQPQRYDASSNSGSLPSQWPQALLTLQRSLWDGPHGCPTPCAGLRQQSLLYMTSS